MKTTLSFILDGQKLRRVDDNTVASNAVNLPKAVFENLRENEWAGFGSYTAEFKNGDIVICIPLAGTNECAVPHEALVPGTMRVTVYAENIDGEEINCSITSTEAEVRVERGPSKHGDNSRVPTADEIAQIKAAAEEAASVRKDADAGKFKGDTGATPRLTVGSVSTLEAGEEATAEITGTAENPVLNISIPRGISGESLYVIATKDELDDRAKSLARITESATMNVLWIGEDELVANITLKAFSCYTVSYIRRPTAISYTEVLKGKSLQTSHVSDEQISAAVTEYLDNNPISETLVDDVISALSKWEGGRY